MRHEKLPVSSLGYKAELTTYLLDNYSEIDINRKRPLVIICPGGGYTYTSVREAEAIAIQMNAMGIHAAILNYSVAPAVFPVALTQLAVAVATARENAQIWNVDADNISVLGFSAGGHVAGSLGVFWNSTVLREALPAYTAEQVKPDRMVLCYPVILANEYSHEGSFQNLLGDEYSNRDKRNLVSLEAQVTTDTPPTFLWHTAEDLSVPPQNSLFFADALIKNGIPCEYHLYPRGGHGLALANEETCSKDREDSQIVPSCQNWIGMAGRFLCMDLK